MAPSLCLTIRKKAMRNYYRKVIDWLLGPSKKYGVYVSLDLGNGTFSDGFWFFERTRSDRYLATEEQAVQYAANLNKHSLDAKSAWVYRARKMING